MKPFLFLPVVFCVGAWGACLPISGDHIAGRDLALVDPRFSSLPATLQIGYAPVPGVVRRFAATELQRIARANGIAPGYVSEVCFEVPMHAPADGEFVESMLRSLPLTSSLQLVDRGRAAIPVGRIEFPLSGLEPPAQGNGGVQLWRGFVQYTDTRRIALWARIAATVSYVTVIAVQDLAANVPIDAAALRTETRNGPVNRAAFAMRVEDVAGKIFQRPLKAGAEVPLSILDEPPTVRRGDSVSVEVQSGPAVLRFDAVAQASARAGEIAELRNPITGKIFHARISARPSANGSKALIIVGRGPAL